MLFENHDVDSRAGKQEAKHHADWATASDATAGLEVFWQRRGGLYLKIL